MTDSDCIQNSGWLECVPNLTNIIFSSIFAHKHVMCQPSQDPSLSWAVMNDVSCARMPTLPEQLVSPRNIPRRSQQFSRELPILQALFLTEMWRGTFSVLSCNAFIIIFFQTTCTQTDKLSTRIMQIITTKHHNRGKSKFIWLNYDVKYERIDALSLWQYTDLKWCIHLSRSLCSYIKQEKYRVGYP